MLSSSYCWVVLTSVSSNRCENKLKLSRGICFVSTKSLQISSYAKNIILQNIIFYTKVMFQFWRDFPCCIFIFPEVFRKEKRPYLSTQSESREQWLEAGASWPPTAYKNPLYVATPTPPLLLDIEAHRLHLFVCGSKHSIDFKQELPSRPPTAYSLG